MRSLSVRIFLFILLIAGTIVACKKDNPPAPPVSNVDLKKGLLLYLPFDGNMADSSGNGNVTTPYNGAALTYDEHGYTAQAFGATGVGESIRVINNGSIKFDTAYTISLDFMVRNNNPLQAFLSMVNYSSGWGPTFTMGVIVPGHSNFNWGGNDSTAGCDNFGAGDPHTVSDTTSFIPQPENWYNLVCNYNKGTIKTYINGKLVSSKTGTGSRALLCPSSQIIVGAWWSGGVESLNGKLDEIRMYNRNLNADEIKELAKDFQNNN